MSEINLDFLQKIMPKFKAWLKSEVGAGMVHDRAHKMAFFKTLLSKENLQKLDEGALRDLIRSLESFGGWTNKDWLLEQMLQSGLAQIRTAFDRLIYSKEPLAIRFDAMREIRQMGAASISEILAQLDLTKYAIWNRRARQALVRLGIKPSLISKSSQITGTQYQDFCNLMQNVLAQVNKTNPEIRDLFDLDFLLYYIFLGIEEEALKLPPEKFEHNAAIEQILQLGDGLGFEVKKEFPVTKGCRIDALWKSQIANLGSVAYAFEVHKAGSKDSAILNLQRIQKADPSIQKLVIVSTEKEIAKFKEEVASLPEGFRNSVGYFRVKDLQSALEHQMSLKNILSNIGLPKGRTEISE